MDGRRVVALHDERLVAVALEQADQLSRGDPRQDRRVGDLVAVQVEDRQDDAIGRRVQELVRVPGGAEWTGLGLAVADYAGYQQVRVVEGGAEGVGQAVAKLAALVDR